MKLDLSFTSYANINPKWIKDLSVTPETINSEKIAGEKLHDIGCGNDLLDMPLSTRKMKIDELNDITSKTSVHQSTQST